MPFLQIFLERVSAEGIRDAGGRALGSLVVVAGKSAAAHFGHTCLHKSAVGGGRRLAACEFDGYHIAVGTDYGGEDNASGDLGWHARVARHGPSASDRTAASTVGVGASAVGGSAVAFFFAT